MIRNKKKSFRKVLMLILCAILLSSNFIVAHGAQRFGVQIVIPENQQGTANSFFDLVMDPGAEQTVEIDIRNMTDKPITVLLDIATATTDDGGTVFYRPQADREPDDSLLFAMEDIASVQSSVDLGPNETVRIPVILRMPEEEFDGTLAGGISFREEVDEEAALAETDGMLVYNFITEIAILLRQNQNPVAPDLLLNHVGASQRNWRNMFIANFQNPERMFINEMEIYANITAVGETDILFEQHWDQMQVAPNSHFNFGIPLEGQPFVAGDYLLQVEVNANNGSWSFTREFTVTEEEARAFNETDVSLQSTLSLWIFIAIGAGVLLVAFILYMVLFRKKSKKTQDKAVDELVKEIKAN